MLLFRIKVTIYEIKNTTQPMKQRNEKNHDTQQQN